MAAGSIPSLRAGRGVLAARLSESQDELVGLAADAGFLDLLAVVVGRVAEEGTLGFEAEAGGFDLAYDQAALDPVEGRGDRRADTRSRLVVDDEIDAAGLQ